MPFGQAQSYYYTQGHKAYHLLDRMDILYGSDDFHSSLRKYTRKEALELIQENPSAYEDDLTTQYLIKDNHYAWSMMEDREIVNMDAQVGSEEWATRKPFLKHFYKTEANLFEIHSEDLNLTINPVLNLNVGKASSSSNIIFQNTRGIELQGDIDDKLYFFSSIYENQADFNEYHLQRIERFQTIPGQGFYKNYESSIYDKIDGFDFLNAKAYLGLDISKSVSIELGHDNHFIGNGYRSLLMSDYSHNYFYFKFLVNVWKFNYQSIFAELAAAPSELIPGNEILPKKYMSSHYLSFKPKRNIEIGFFETVVFAREDHFELQYLNPVILYRTVEQFIGSPDNALLGLNFKYNFARKYSFYHQTILDEFKLDEITSSSGWWANKFGFQFGLKAIDFANIKNLDAQLEYNVVRPYTYAHRDTLPIEELLSVASFSHHSQPLAHPIGSNFRELAFLINYMPTQKISLNGRFILSDYGEDVNGSNWGTNIFLPTESREQDFGNSIGQGEEVKVSLIGVDLSYMFYHNFYLDARLLYRKQTSDQESLSFDTKYFSLGLRMNMANRNIDY